MKYGKTFLLLLLLSFCTQACKEPEPIPEPSKDYSKGTFVLNEGNFTWGNASLDFIDESGQMENMAYSNTSGLPLGDVAQSLLVHNGFLYLVINNSGKVLRLQLNDLSQTGVLTGLTSPRYLLPISNDKAYLSDLYGNGLSILDLEQMTLTGNINITGWTEQMLLANGEVFVAGMGSAAVWIVDPNSDQVIDSIAVGEEPESMVLDQNGKLWVLCGSGAATPYPELHRIDPASRQTEVVFSFADSSLAATDLSVDAAGGTLYFIRGGIFQMPIGATALPGQALVEAGDHLFYGLAVDGRSGDLLATDALDYVQPGWLYRYATSDGSQTGSWRTGVIPGSVLVSW